MPVREARRKASYALEKCPTGIVGLDEVTGGGFPRGRPTLICGGPGCGKTVLGMEFLLRGATQYDEAGVFVAFEETAEELIKNTASLGFDLSGLRGRKKIHLEHVSVERNEIEETGEYDLEGLFIRLGHAIDAIGAKRLVLDTLESLFSGFGNLSILRAELRRLFRWLKTKGVTAVVTAETGEGKLTRHGMEEYVADCVIMLDHRVVEQNSVRRLRVIKYRGSEHGTNEYPFLIFKTGISVLPLSSLRLAHQASAQRVSSGIPRLDAMLGGKGFFRGSSILVSGGAGTGKSSLAATFVQATCERGERALYFVTEQSVDEVVRGMRSIGIDLEHWIKAGLLHCHADRPSSSGLENHLVTFQNVTDAVKPKVVVVDPITNYGVGGTGMEVKSLVTRLIDLLKARQITALFTSLASAEHAGEDSVVGVSSLMDCWLLLRNLESNGERNRGLYVLKSRGMAHSNQVREFILTDHGVELIDVYTGASGVLFGSARLAQAAQERANALARKEETQAVRLLLEDKQRELETKIGALRNRFKQEQRELLSRARGLELREKQLSVDRRDMALSRQADAAPLPGNGRR